MAMNKAEKEKMEYLEIQAAFRRTEKVEPDVQPPVGMELRKGFLFNSYGGRVEPACTTSIYHAFGRDDKTTTQGSRALYSTKILALKAMRFEIEENMAKTLRNIDLQIAAGK